MPAEGLEGDDLPTMRSHSSKRRRRTPAC